MARNVTIQALRTTRAALDAQAAAGGLLAGEPYLITDESRIAMGTGANAYTEAASGGGASIVAISYDNRADLRTNDTDDWAVIDGLGLFQRVMGSSEPDDDESCFATAAARWLLQCVHWDVVDSWQLPDDEMRDEFDEDSETRLDSAETRWPGRILFGTASQTVTSLAALTQTTFSATVTGAAVGNHVLATPPTALGARISVFASVTSQNTVTIYLNNPSASTQSLTAGTWRVAVIQET